MSKEVNILVILSLLLYVLNCLENITSFGVSNPEYFSTVNNIGAIGVGCGFDYTNQLMYMFGGVLDDTDSLNPNYATWDIGTNENALKGTNDYSTITSPSFQNTLIDTSVLTTVQGYTQLSGKWKCFQVDCTKQLNDDPYIYIVSPLVYNSGGNTIGTPSMAIFDMSIQNYIAPSQYTYSIPGGAKTDACITTDGSSLYVIGGQNGVSAPYYTSIYKYTPPTSGDFASTVDDKWEFMGDMRLPLSKRGCSTDKLSRGRFLYMFGGRNDDTSTASLGWPGVEYVDLDDYETLGFNASYYDLGPIIDTFFKNSNPQDWIAPHCFPSQYAQDIIYCGGGILKQANGQFFPENKQVWIFERVYEYTLYPLLTQLINAEPAVYGCSLKANDFGAPYLTYPECAGMIAYKIGETLGRSAYSSDIDTFEAPNVFISGCVTPWWTITDVNGNFGLKFYLGGFGTNDDNSPNPLVFRENEESFFYTNDPTKTPSQMPSITPTNVPSLMPTLVTSAPDASATPQPSLAPLEEGETRPPTSITPAPVVSPVDSEPQKAGLNQTTIIIIVASVAGGIILIVIIALIICKCRASKSTHGFGDDDGL